MRREMDLGDGNIIEVHYSIGWGVRCYEKCRSFHPLTQNRKEIKGGLESIDFDKKTFVFGGKQY